MIRAARITARHLADRVAARLERLGVDLWVPQVADYRLRSRDTGWTARKLDEVWAVRRALHSRIDPALAKLWAVGLAVASTFLITFTMVGFVFYRIMRDACVMPSTM